MEERKEAIDSTFDPFTQRLLDGVSDEYMRYADISEKLGFNRKQVPHRREEPKINRNEPCPCESGKKYKKCCLNN